MHKDRLLPLFVTIVAFQVSRVDTENTPYPIG